MDNFGKFVKMRDGDHTQGKSLTFDGQWGPFILKVTLKKIEGAPGMFLLSIVHPLLGTIDKEMVSRDLFDFLLPLTDLLGYELKEKDNA